MIQLNFACARKKSKHQSKSSFETVYPGVKSCNMKTDAVIFILKHCMLSTEHKAKYKLMDCVGLEEGLSAHLLIYL